MGRRAAPPPTPTERVDERDTMFARMARRPDTPAYADYYGARRPDLTAVDDRLRRLPGLLQRGGRHYDPQLSGRAGELFEAIPELVPDPKAVAEWTRRLESAADLGRAIQQMVRSLGAVAVGFTGVPPELVYTVRGRHDRSYGETVALAHPTAIMFLVEMDHAAMQRAPMAETIVESARQYHRAAVIAKTVVAVLEARGHSATANFDARYDLILPPMAIHAGLGELGRNNILIADRYGSRVRIGAVTTDLELPHDRPISLGARHFCEICKKCAESCPSRALTTGAMIEVRGVAKWPTHVERCYGYWRVAGTDCGVCMAVCPFSHRNSWFHNLVRFAIRHCRWVHRFALWCDDRIYGRTWKHLRPGAEGNPGEER
jgi:reductive dehalogenase